MKETSLLIRTWTMGCAESIISNIVAKSNSNGQKVNINQANGKVQPAPLRGERVGRDEARERRKKAVMERHAKKQVMAKTISENAMAEKERLSTSTWMSWRSSGVNSDIISPAVSISVRGSDGTASPDPLPNPAIAYVNSEGTNPSTQPEEDINANHMQIRTMELPNQVTEGPDEPSNQNGELIDERLSDSGGKERVQKEQNGTLGDGNTRMEEQKSLQEPFLNGNGCQGGGRKDDITPLMDDGKDKTEKEKKRKMRGKRKAVKFTDQDLGDENHEDCSDRK
eukprot:XP_011663937.1 PREDICTED: uncharacterized protein LOC100889544 [Strongylocentrotus purpuratus]